jgi:AraC-like DNA-binding protein
VLNIPILQVKLSCGTSVHDRFTQDTMSSSCTSHLEAMAELLHEPRLDHSFYCRGSLRGAWGIALPKTQAIRYCFAAEGTVWVVTNERIRLDPGDLVFLFGGEAHRVATSPDEPAVPLASLPITTIGPQSSQLQHGETGPRTVMLLGKTSFDPPEHPLRSLLPRSLVLRQSDAGRTARAHLLLSSLRDELIAPQLGSETFVTRLVELMLLEVIRQWAELRPQGQRGWLGALRDPNLGGILAIMHRHSEQAFTVEALAAQAGLSKSVFCERFRAALGVPPLRYLTELRMQLGARLLSYEKLSIAETAQRLGYGSEAAFSRAFKRTWGHSPGQSRHSRG